MGSIVDWRIIHGEELELEANRTEQMRLFLAVTDSDWFNYLSELRPDEVNFWRPSASHAFRGRSPGEPPLFKLHSPNDYIVGGGFFSHYTVLPASFAWVTFGTKNGAAATEDEMRRRVERYRRVEPNGSADYSLGCILLWSPFFFSREEWLPVKRQCAVTGSHVLHVLDAAYIRRYAVGGTHSPTNGLLLRHDVHTLFDRGYLTVTPDYRIELSHRLKDEFDNGKECYSLEGRNIVLPESPAYRPSGEQLTWHNENVYRP